MIMNDEQFQEDTEALRRGGYVSLVDDLRARDTAQREALARVEAEHADDVKRYRQLLNEAGRDRYAAQKQLAEAVRLLRFAYDHADQHRPGSLPNEQIVRAFLARHAQVEQQEAHGAQAGDEQDQVHQLAFEVGEPDEDGDGYHFSADQLDEFVAKLPRAALATQPAEWVDPVALHPAENLYNQGFADGASEAKRLNAVRGAEHDQ